LATDKHTSSDRSSNCYAHHVLPRWFVVTGKLDERPNRANAIDECQAQSASCCADFVARVIHCARVRQSHIARWRIQLRRRPRVRSLSSEARRTRARNIRTSFVSSRRRLSMSAVRFRVSWGSCSDGSRRRGMACRIKIIDPAITVLDRWRDPSLRFGLSYGCRFGPREGSADGARGVQGRFELGAEALSLRQDFIQLAQRVP